MNFNRQTSSFGQGRWAAHRAHSRVLGRSMCIHWRTVVNTILSMFAFALYLHNFKRFSINLFLSLSSILIPPFSVHVENIHRFIKIFTGKKHQAFGFYFHIPPFMHLLCFYFLFFISLTVFINLHFELALFFVCWPNFFLFFCCERERRFGLWCNFVCCCGLWHAKVFNKIGKFQWQPTTATKTEKKCLPTKTNKMQKNKIFKKWLSFAMNSIRVLGVLMYVCLPLFRIYSTSLSSISILLSSTFHALFFFLFYFYVCALRTESHLSGWIENKNVNPDSMRFLNAFK